MARTDVGHELVVMHEQYQSQFIVVQMREIFRAWVNKYPISILNGPENKTVLALTFT
jgi:hypothetical protein